MTIGILGGGQLARMLGLAGLPLGLKFVIYDPSPDVCGSAIARHVRAAYDDKNALEAFARSVDVVTYEFENVPVEAARFVEGIRPIHPHKSALHETQDRLREKELFRRLDIPTADFRVVDDLADARDAGAALGYPLVLKSRSGGYDGKGQVVIPDESSLEHGWSESQRGNLIAEGFVPFEREVSMIGARRPSGETVFYDIAENQHREGILRTSHNRPGDPVAELARNYVARLFDELQYFGVLGLELFHVGDDLLANEYAPRVHNTGHWTIDGTRCSQFENHLRAILDWPLGDTTSHGFSAMLNFIGTLPDAQACLATPDVHYHAYDKSPRPGRKIGHITVCAPDTRVLDERVAEIQRLMN